MQQVAAAGNPCSRAFHPAMRRLMMNHMIAGLYRSDGARALFARQVVVGRGGNEGADFLDPVVVYELAHIFLFPPFPYKE